MRQVIVALSVLVMWTAVQAGEPAATTGWRGDGTGRFPNATPVTEWSYTPQSPVVGLKYQSARPAGDDAGKDAKEVWGGDVPAWLMVGGFNAKEIQAALDESFIGDEASVQPAEGDKVGDFVWEAGGQADYRDAFTEKEFKKHRYGIYALGGTAVRSYRLPGKGANTVAYAASYLYSQTAGKVSIAVNHQDAMRMWVNGTVVYSGNAAFVNWGGYDDERNMVAFTVPTRCPRFEAELKKGWNRLLVKVVRKADAGWFGMRIGAPADVKYESKNIRWVTPMPSWSWSSPIVVGDRVFVTSEPDELVCINKADGKILWRKKSTTFDAVSEEEKATNALYKEIEPLNAELHQCQDVEKALDLRAKIITLLRKIDPVKYGLGGKQNHEAHAAAVGYAIATPVSDGDRVYAFFYPATVACYDLQGNRQWVGNVLDLGAAKTADGRPYRPFPVVSSPVLVGDRLVLFKGWFRALDKKTGKPLWDTGNLATEFIKAEDNIPKSGSTASLVAFRVGGEDFVLGFNGRVVRVSDGKVVSDKERIREGYCTPVVDGDEAYLWPADKFKLTLNAGDFEMKSMGPTGVDYWTMSSPLLHEGLIYTLAPQGVLTVSDAATLKVVYTQRLEMWPLMNYNAIGATPSVTLGGKHIYLMDNQGVCVVIEPGRTYKQVAYNRLGYSMNHPWLLTTCERFEGSPVFDGECLYVRGEKNMYCIGSVSPR